VWDELGAPERKRICNTLQWGVDQFARNVLLYASLKRKVEGNNFDLDSKTI